MKSMVVHISKVFAVVAATLLVADAARSTADAGTIKFKATSLQVDLACLNYSGGATATAGNGPGGYGCKTDKGEVSCDKNGNCTGTCEKCGTRIKVGQGTVRQALANSVNVIDGSQGQPSGPKRTQGVIPTGGGILDGGSGFGAQGPAATGSPTGGGAAPPRSQGGRIR